MFFSSLPADFLLFSIFGWFIAWIYASIYPVLFLGSIMSAYYLYYSAKMNPDNMLVFMNLPFQVPFRYAPIVMLIFAFSNGKSNGISNLVGYLAAHLYYFIKNVLGTKYDKRFFALPAWMNRGLQNILT